MNKEVFFPTKIIEICYKSRKAQKENSLKCFYFNYLYIPQIQIIMDLYIRFKNYLTDYDFSRDDIRDLMHTLRKESIMTLWCLRKKLNGCYEIYFGYDTPFVIKSEAEREYLIKKIDEDILHK